MTALSLSCTRRRVSASRRRIRSRRASSEQSRRWTICRPAIKSCAQLKLHEEIIQSIKFLNICLAKQYLASWQKEHFENGTLFFLWPFQYQLSHRELRAHCRRHSSWLRTGYPCYLSDNHTQVSMLGTSNCRLSHTRWSIKLQNSVKKKVKL